MPEPVPSNKGPLAAAILITGVGIGWLLTAAGYVPDVYWVWTISLAMCGLLAFVVFGLDKVSVVVGPLFLFASVTSVLRQTGRFEMKIELPLLVTVFGLLLFIAQMNRIPKPKWILPAPRGQADE